MSFIASLIPIAAFACGTTTAEAVAEARKALQSDSASDDKAALKCLTDAVEKLDARLEALVAGKVEFTGDVTAPAFIHTSKRPDNVSTPEQRSQAGAQ